MGAAPRAAPARCHPCHPPLRSPTALAQHQQRPSPAGAVTCTEPMPFASEKPPEILLLVLSLFLQCFPTSRSLLCPLAFLRVLFKSSVQGTFSHLEQ